MSVSDLLFNIHNLVEHHLRINASKNMEDKKGQKLIL